MEVGNTLGRVHHRQFWAVGVAGVQVGLDFIAQRLRQGGDLFVKIGHAIVDIDADFVKQLAVLLKRVAVENFHAVTKHNGVRHLHHGGLDVQREHHACFIGIVNFLFVEIA